MEINGTHGVTVNQLMEINCTWYSQLIDVNGTNSQSIDGDKLVHGVTVNQLMEINGTRCNSQSIDGDKRYMVQ